MMYMAGCVRLNKCSYLEILDISSIGHHNQSANQHYVKLVEPFSHHDYHTVGWHLQVEKKTVFNSC